MNRNVWNWGHAVRLQANLSIQFSSKFTSIGYMGEIWHRRTGVNGGISGNSSAGSGMFPLVH